ncbi:MAG: SURF1 family protein, partial [Caulobacteraceae bacterium]
ARLKRFSLPAIPVGLTLAAGVAFCILVGLGVWQLHRLRWKEGILSHIAALSHEPAQPLSAVLAKGASGGDVAFQRVETSCLAGGSQAPDAFRYAIRDNHIGWRLMTLCRLPAGERYDSILLDRGMVGSLTGAMAPRPMRFSPPGRVVGVLRSPGGKPLLGAQDMSGGAKVFAFRVVDQAAISRLAAMSGAARPAPFVLAVESESPAPAGVRPAPLPLSIPNHHFVYALTWFALAAALVWFWLAKVLEREA